MRTVAQADLPVTMRELNRTLLHRQLLLARKRITPRLAVSLLVALQAQYAPSPYIALWSRVSGFRKETLTKALRDGSIVKAGAFRTTLHVVARDDYPFIAASYAESQRGRQSVRDADAGALRAAFPERPFTSNEAHAIGRRVLETDDRWAVAFALRVLPTVRTSPVGDWPHTRPSPEVVWGGELPDAQEGANHVVRAYLAAYGPATRHDIQQFTGFKLRQIDPALAAMSERDGYFDVPEGVVVAGNVAAPVRFLPAFDSIILAHRDRSRILPDDYRDVVLRRANATTLATFTVDGFIAGSWKATRVRGRWAVTAEAFAPLPRSARTELEGERDTLERFYNS